MKINPLFIYGPSGLGKTHLLYAITNEIKRKKPAAKIIYIKGVDFGESAEVFAAVVKGSGRAEVYLDAMGSAMTAAIEFDNADYQGVYNQLTQPVSGVHDVYIMFNDIDICLDSWQFL